MNKRRLSIGALILIGVLGGTGEFTAWMAADVDPHDALHLWTAPVTLPAEFPVATPAELFSDTRSKSGPSVHDDGSGCSGRHLRDDRSVQADLRTAHCR